MALVLVFSVQGIADALTFGTTRTGDLKTVFPGEEFSITFSVNRDSEADIKNSEKRQVTEDLATLIDSSGYEVEYFTIDGVSKSFRKGTNSTHLDSSGYIVNTTTGKRKRFDTSDNEVNEGDTGYDTAKEKKGTPNTPISDSLQHHYNDEAIVIVSPISLKRNRTTIWTTTTRPTRPTSALATNYSLAEETDNRDLPSDKTLSSSITLKGLAPSTLGEFQIEVIDVTHLNDFPENNRPNLQARQVFTIYVMPTHSLSAPILSFSENRTSDYQTANDYADQQVDNLFGTGDAAFATPTQKDNTPLTYKVVGSGRLYVKETYTPVSNYETPKDSVGSKKSELTTSADADVYLDMNGSSNKVTAYVRDRDSNTTGKSVVFVFQFATIEVDHGNNQTGAPNAQLGNSLGVKVKDSKGRVLSGLAVRFTPSSTERLKPVPGTIVYVDNSNPPAWGDVTDYTNIDDTVEARATSPSETGDGQAAWVQTDSSGVAEVYLRIGQGTSDVTLTATISAPPNVTAPTKTLYATRKGSVGIPSIEVVSGDNQKSDTNGNLSESLVVLVRDGHSNPYPSQRVTFTTTKGNLITDLDYQVNNGDNQTDDGPALTVTANTDSHGKAAVTYQLGNYSGASTVTAEISNTTTVPTYQRRITFNINGGGSQPQQPQTNTITVIPASLSGAAGSTETLSVTPSTATVLGNAAFTTAGGTITGSGAIRTVILPNTAGSNYSLAVSASGFPDRTVTVTVTTGTTGTGTTLTTRPASLSGAAGEAVPLGLLPITATFTVTGNSAFTTAGGLVSGTGALRSVTLPNTAGSYSLIVNATGYTPVTVPVTVTGATTGTGTTPGSAVTGTLSIMLSGTRVGNQQAIRVTAQPAPSSALVVTLSGATNPPTLTISAGESSVTRVATLPTTTGAHTLTVSATGYGSNSVTVPAATGSQQPQPQPTVGAPSSVQIRSEVFPSGTVNTQLAQPLTVRVLDANGTGVADVKVVFRVTSGQGRLSQRGNGRAIAAETDARGDASADYTPMSASSKVRATATGVTQTVTFTVTATGSVPATIDPGGTTRTTAIDPKILVGAANRPAMVWVDNGMLYGLTGAEATKIAENVNAAAIGGGKVYWTEKTGASAGTINSANLDGSGAKVLTTIMAIPMGISVDTIGSKLYWTNSRGRVQSANLNGSGIRNVQQNLTNPSDIALGNGHIYWTEDGNSIRRVNMTGTKVVKDVAVGLMDVGGIAVGDGKVYWTEKTGASAGTINGANLDGTQFKTLATIKAVPMGIAVDTAGKKLYWTNSRGRVQSANLNGSSIRNVVDGLGTPSHLAIASASQGTTAAKPTKPATQPPKKDTTAYDVNGDGTVDNTDASLVSEAMGTDNKTYDVNGDGTVNFFDLMLVFDNRDAGAAGAPTIVGMQLTAAQVDILQEQIDLLIATGNRSPAALKTLIYLQQLIATARPEKTQLLANYPNPFNPETWIPYELATDTEVRITIYNAQGLVIRRLQLGQQSAGYYADRERAAYWDGRNALGEQVASGIYFYQLETDDMSSLRKMVILK